MKVRYRIMSNGLTFKVQRRGLLGWHDLNAYGDEAGSFDHWASFSTQEKAEDWALNQWGRNRVRKREFRVV